MAYICKLPSGKWKAEVTLPIKLPNGRPRRTAKSFKHKGVAERWASDLETKLERGNWADPAAGRRTLREFVEIWQAGQVVEWNTARAREYRLKVVVEQWGGHRLADIKYLDVQAWVAQMTRDREGPHAIRARVQLLGGILDDAVRARIIESNPARGIRYPSAVPHEDRVLEPDEEEALLLVLAEPYRTLVKALIYTGMRWEDAAGLHRTRLNRLRRRVSVVEVLLRDGTIKEYPKTGCGRRTLPLTKDLCRDLDQLAAGWPGGRCDPGHCAEPDGALVFGTATGAALHYENFRLRVWRPALAAARLCLLSSGACAEEHRGEDHRIPEPWPTVHDLRHTYGTRLADNGVEIHDLAALMGHRSWRSVQRYVHSGEGRFDKALKALEALEINSGSAQIPPKIKESAPGAVATGTEDAL